MTIEGIISNLSHYLQHECTLLINQAHSGSKRSLHPPFIPDSSGKSQTDSIKLWRFTVEFLLHLL